MEIALEDISTIKSVLHSGTPIEALKGAQSLNKAYQLWMEKMRIKVGQPRPWEFQPDSKVCGCAAACDVGNVIAPINIPRLLCLAELP